MKTSQLYLILAATTLCSSLAWTQEKCDSVFLGERVSEYLKPVDQLIREEYEFEVSDEYLVVVDKVVNQKQAATEEQKAMIQEIFKILGEKLGDRAMQKRVENILERKVTLSETAAVRLAQGLGRTENGRNNKMRGFSGNYTEEQMARKDRILELAGFSLEERMALQSSKLIEEVLTKLANEDLLLDRETETAWQIRAVNKEILRQMNEASPAKLQTAADGRKESLSKKEAVDLYEAVTRHSIARLMNIRKYDPEGGIGFCFGRAMTAHLEALSRGVAKDSIRKVFVTGQMKAIVGKIVWQFHVVTAVKNSEGGWWVIDPFVGKVMTLEAWYAKMKSHDINHRLRLQVTDASRFAAYGSYQYGKSHMLSDFYNNYFKDLMTYYRQKANGELPPKSIWIRVMDWALAMIRLGI